MIDACVLNFPGNFDDTPNCQAAIKICVVCYFVQELVIPVLLKFVTRSEYSDIRQTARQALAMVGYTFPVKGRGVRILSIDGGGTRYVNFLVLEAH